MMSPSPGDSTLMTSAPWSARIIVASGPEIITDRSSTRTPCSGPGMAGQPATLGRIHGAARACGPTRATTAAAHRRHRGAPRGRWRRPAGTPGRAPGPRSSTPRSAAPTRAPPMAPIVAKPRASATPSWLPTRPSCPVGAWPMAATDVVLNTTPMPKPDDRAGEERDPQRDGADRHEDGSAPCPRRGRRSPAGPRAPAGQCVRAERTAPAVHDERAAEDHGPGDQRRRAVDAGWRRAGRRCRSRRRRCSRTAGPRPRRGCPGCGAERPVGEQAEERGSGRGPARRRGSTSGDEDRARPGARRASEPAARAASPGRQARHAGARRCGRLDGGGPRRSSGRAARSSRTGTRGSSPRKTQRQPTCSVIQPAATGATRLGTTHAVDRSANSRGWSSAGQARPMPT